MCKSRYQSNMAKEVLDTIMNIQPKDSSGGSGETRESRVFRIATDMLDKLPDDYVPHEVGCAVCISRTTYTVVHILSGEGSTTENGYPVQYEHLPAPRGGPHAACAQFSAFNSTRPPAGH